MMQLQGNNSNGFWLKWVAWFINMLFARGGGRAGNKRTETWPLHARTIAVLIALFLPHFTEILAATWQPRSLVTLTIQRIAIRVEAEVDRFFFDQTTGGHFYGIVDGASGFCPQPQCQIDSFISRIPSKCCLHARIGIDMVCICLYNFVYVCFLSQFWSNGKVSWPGLAVGVVPINVGVVLIPSIAWFEVPVAVTLALRGFGFRVFLLSVLGTGILIARVGHGQAGNLQHE